MWSWIEAARDLEYGTPPEKPMSVNELATEIKNHLRGTCTIVRIRLEGDFLWRLSQQPRIFYWKSCFITKPSLQNRTLSKGAAKLGWTSCDHTATESCHVWNSETRWLIQSHICGPANALEWWLQFGLWIRWRCSNLPLVGP